MTFTSYETATPSGQYTPIVPQDRLQRANAFIPHSYLIYLRPVVCSHCHSTQETSEVWLISANGPIHQRKPAISFDLPLPIGFTRLRPQSVPVCAACLGDLLQSRTIVQVDDERRWSHALAKSAAEALVPEERRIAGPSARRAKPDTDISDL